MTPTRPDNPLKRLTSGGWAKGALRLAVAVILVALVLRWAGGDSWRHLSSPALLPLIAGGALIHLTQRAARIKKWQLMIAPTSVEQHPYSFLLRIQLIGMVANLAVPVSEAVKVWAVARNKAEVKIAVKSIVVDMALHTGLVGLTGAVAALLAAWWTPAIWAASLTMLFGALIVIGVSQWWPESERIADRAPAVWGLAAVETACQLAIYWLAFDAIGIRIATLPLLALAPVLYIVDLLNFTPSGLGLREALFAAVLGVMPEASSDVGVAAGLLISTMLLLATLVGGGLALLLPAGSRGED